MRARRAKQSPRLQDPFEVILPRTFVIEPPRGWRSPRWSQLWHYRDLLRILVWRDIKVRYRQTALGVAWVIIQPVLTMIIFSVFLGSFSRVPSDDLPYPLFSYVGILAWGYFSAQFVRATGCIVGNGSLISKIYFPRLILPLASVVPGLVDFAFGLAFFFGLSWWFREPLHLSAVFILPLLLLMIVLVLGLSFWLGIINVKYRDVSQALPFLVQVWMFATPIVYPLSVVPEKYRPFVALNPMTGIIEGFRSALFGKPLNTDSLTLSAITACFFFVTGLFFFQRNEPYFADRL